MCHFLASTFVVYIKIDDIYQDYNNLRLIVEPIINKLR